MQYFSHWSNSLESYFSSLYKISIAIVSNPNRVILSAIYAKCSTHLLFKCTSNKISPRANYRTIFSNKCIIKSTFTLLCSTIKYNYSDCWLPQAAYFPFFCLSLIMFMPSSVTPPVKLYRRHFYSASQWSGGKCWKRISYFRLSSIDWSLNMS